MPTKHTKKASPLRTWVKMLATTNQMTAELRKVVVEKCGMTLSQFDYLAQLEREGNRGMTLSEVAGNLMVTGGNVTGLTDRLQQEGLVYREPDAHDRRSLRVFMTKEGEKRMATAARIHEAWINDAMGELDSKSMQSLADGVDILRESFKNYIKEK